MKVDNLKLKLATAGLYLSVVLTLAIIAFATFIMVATYNHKGEFNVFALIAIVSACVGLYISKRQYTNRHERNNTVTEK